MTSVREVLRRRLGPHGSWADPRAGFAYVVYWTQTARTWPAERRRAVRRAVEAMVEGDDFRATTYERLYHLDDVDSSAHAGASLIALQRVLQAMDPDSIGGPADGQ